MNLQSHIKDAVLTSGGLAFSDSNAPGKYRDKQFEYFAPESKRFIQEYARYASNYVACRVQGLDPERPWEWQERYFRMADIIRPTASLTRRIDNYKLVLCDDADVEYLMPGAKLEAMGSTWIVTNPINIGGGDGCGIVERCNAAWNYLDYYGNVRTEPLVVENVRANASDSDQQASMLITKGYYQVTCQYNEYTRQIDTNTRMILGSKAYRVTGLGDFFTEFTGGYDTVRLLDFTVRYEEPNGEIDDLKRQVAGGKTFSWDLSILGPESMTAGRTAQFTADSLRCGGAPDVKKHPVLYIWEIDDEAVASVDVHGNVTALTPGDTTIRCTLAQNPEICAAATLTVTAESEGDVMDFLIPPPESLKPLERCTVIAALFRDGTQTGEAVSWKVSGGTPGSYAWSVENGTLALTCYGYSPEPVTVTAESRGLSVSATVKLEGI